MLILCTNDDGYRAVGIRVLSEVARGLGRVEIVAQDREQSARSHSLTMHFPLRVHRIEDDVQAVDGTPTDCVALALAELLEARPDFVLSGINHGPNMGEDVLYSGTVAGAMEATILGVPAIAFSYVGRDPTGIVPYGPLLTRLIPQLIRPGELPPDTLLNVNLPAIDPAEVRGVQVTRLGRRVYSDSVTRAKDPSGREYFWIGGGGVTWDADEGTDFHAIDQGYISVTPLHLDLTNHRLLEAVQRWDLQP